MELNFLSNNLPESSDFRRTSTTRKIRPTRTLVRSLSRDECMGLGLPITLLS